MTILARAEDAAYAAGVGVKTLMMWRKRGHIPPDVNGLYDLAAILDWIGRRDAHHAKIAASRYKRPIIGPGVDSRYGSVTNSGLPPTQKCA